MVEHVEKSLLELDFASLTRRTFTPSPAAWEDQVLYFARHHCIGPRMPGGSITTLGSAPAAAGRAER
jgi:hypothetical protein